MKTNAVIDNILERRSTRVFTDAPVEREDLETIVACGQWAPSAMNRQEWVFVVVPKPEPIAELAAIIKDVLERDSYNMYAPAAAVIVAHKKDATYGREDDGCAMENMFLAAQSLGLGSVWINQLQGICDEAPVRAKLTEFGVPEDYEVHGICALGHIGKLTAPHDRKSEVIWID